jgi:predicted nucleotidyltransferase
LDYRTNEEINIDLNHLAKDIREKYSDAVVILFGSRARQDNLHSSDIDLLVISDSFKSTPFVLRAGTILSLYAGFEEIDILCYTHAEFSRKKKELGVVKQASAEGIILE